jgi:hypothetical protein
MINLWDKHQRSTDLPDKRLICYKSRGKSFEPRRANEGALRRAQVYEIRLRGVVQNPGVNPDKDGDNVRCPVKHNPKHVKLNSTARLYRDTAMSGITTSAAILRPMVTKGAEER